MGLFGGGKKDPVELEQQRDVKGLLKLLGSSEKGNFAARQNAALSLVRLQAMEAVPELVKLAENRDLDVAEHAYLALGLIGGGDAFAYLVRRLDTPDPGRLGHVLWALGNIADPRAFESVASLTAHPTAGVRRNALRALAETDVQKAVPYLVSALRDQDSDSRCQALEGLTKALGQDAMPYVVAALEDEHMFVQRTAIRQLGELGGEAAEPYLLRAVNPDNRSSLLHPAEDALIAMGHPAGLEVVERLLGGFKVDAADDPVFRGSTLLIQFMKQSPDNRARALAYGGRVEKRRRTSSSAEWSRPNDGLPMARSHRNRSSQRIRYARRTQLIMSGWGVTVLLATRRKPLHQGTRLVCDPVSVRPSRAHECCSVLSTCHRPRRRTRKPGLTDRVPICRSWLYQAERGDANPRYVKDAQRFSGLSPRSGGECDSVHGYRSVLPQYRPCDGSG